MNSPILKPSGIREVQFGESVEIIQPVNLYECSIGSRTFIGPFVEIQKGARIGENCKIQSHSFICEMVTIGDDCFIGHGVMFINDDFKDGSPASGDKTKWRATTIGAKVYIGSNATILPVTICEKTVIGAGAVVTGDIDVPGVYAGNPAKLIRNF